MKHVCLLLLAIAATTVFHGCGGTSSATPSGGKSAAELISAGEKALAKNALDDALAAFDDAVDKEPNSATARERRGQVYFRLGKFEKAVDDGNAALKINGKLAGAYFTRGQAEKGLGETDKALEDFSKALELGSDRADVLVARGTLYQQMAVKASSEQARKLKDSAVADFDRALKIDGRDAACLLRRAEILLDTGDFQGAIDDCDRALEIDPRRAEARIARARGLVERGDCDKAVADCDAVIEADGKCLDAYVVRARARVEKSSNMNTLEDIAACDKAIDDGCTAISLSSKIQGDEDALRRAKQDCAAVHDLRGILYDNLRAGKKSFEEFTTALSMDPGLATALVHRALNRAKSDDFSGALGDCNAAIDIDSSRPEAYCGRGTVYRVKRDYALAIKDLEEAITRKYPKAYRELAAVYSAMAALERRKVLALAKAPGDRQRAEYAAAVKNHNEYCEKCIGAASKALEANRHLAMMYLLRGFTYANSKKVAQAFADFNAAISEDPRMAPAYFNRAIYYNNKGMFAEAIRDFTKVIELQPGAIQAYRRRAQVYQAVGDPVSATADHRKFDELVKKYRDEQNASAESPDELFGNPAKRAEVELGPAFQPLVKARKELETKLDATAGK